MAALLLGEIRQRFRPGICCCVEYTLICVWRTVSLSAYRCCPFTCSRLLLRFFCAVAVADTLLFYHNGLLLSLLLCPLFFTVYEIIEPKIKAAPTNIKELIAQNGKKPYLFCVCVCPFFFCFLHKRITTTCSGASVCCVLSKASTAPIKYTLLCTRTGKLLCVLSSCLILFGCCYCPRSINFRTQALTRSVPNRYFMFAHWAIVSIYIVCIFGCFVSMRYFVCNMEKAQ